MSKTHRENTKFSGWLGNPVQSIDPLRAPFGVDRYRRSVNRMAWLCGAPTQTPLSSVNSCHISARNGSTQSFAFDQGPKFRSVIGFPFDSQRSSHVVGATDDIKTLMKANCTSKFDTEKNHVSKRESNPWLTGGELDALTHQATHRGPATFNTSQREVYFA